MSMRMCVSWSVHSLSTHPGMLSGPAAFCRLTLCSVSRVETTSTSSSRLRGAFIIVVFLFSSNRLKFVLSLRVRLTPLPPLTVVVHVTNVVCW